MEIFLRRRLIFSRVAPKTLAPEDQLSRILCSSAKLGSGRDAATHELCLCPVSRTMTL